MKLTLFDGLLFLLYISVVGTVICMDIFEVGKGKAPTENPLGWVSVFASVICFGCYGVYMKAPSVVSSNCSPFVFQIYMNCGLVLSSVVIVSYKSCAFSWWGFLGALIWLVAMIFAYIAVQNLGLALAPAIWGAITIICSFVWGVAIFDEKPQSLPLSILALLILIIGINIATSSESQTVTSLLKKSFSSRSSTIHPEKNEHQPLLKEARTQEIQTPDDEMEFKKNKKLGLFCAITMGLVNGSLMVPVHYYSDPTSDMSDMDQNVGYIASFGAGVASLTIILIFVYLVISRHNIVWHFYEVGPYAFITGVFWGCGNLCATYGTVILGQSVGFPITQTCILVNGIWGIVYFKEIQGVVPIFLYGLGTAVVLAGVILLGLYGAA